MELPSHLPEARMFKLKLRAALRRAVHARGTSLVGQVGQGCSWPYLTDMGRLPIMGHDGRTCDFVSLTVMVPLLRVSL